MTALGNSCVELSLQWRRQDRKHGLPGPAAQPQHHSVGYNLNPLMGTVPCDHSHKLSTNTHTGVVLILQKTLQILLNLWFQSFPEVTLHPHPLQPAVLVPTEQAWS